MSLSVENARRACETARAACEIACRRRDGVLADPFATDDERDTALINSLRAASALARASEVAHDLEMEVILGEDHGRVARTFAALDYGAARGDTR